MNNTDELLTRLIHALFLFTLFVLCDSTMFSFYLFDVGLAAIHFLIIKRHKKSSPLTKTEIYTSRVRLSDVDVFGVVNNSKYFKIAERARFDLCGKKGILRKVFHSGYTPVLAGAVVRFRRSLRPFQKYFVESKIVYCDKKYIYISQSIKDSKSGNLYFIILCRVAFVGRKGAVKPADVLGTTNADIVEINNTYNLSKQTNNTDTFKPAWERAQNHKTAPLFVALAAEADVAVAQLA